MENKIPTAEEFVREDWVELPYKWEDIKDLLIRFAQLHVEAALKSAAESEEYYGNESIRFNKSQREQILNAYPEENVR